MSYRLCYRVKQGTVLILAIPPQAISRWLSEEAIFLLRVFRGETVEGGMVVSWKAERKLASHLNIEKTPQLKLAKLRTICK